MKTIGIVGCGAIGRGLVRASEKGLLRVPVAGITSRAEERAREFLSTLRAPVRYLDREHLIRESDLIVEAAGGSVVPELAREIFAAGRDLLVISVGALLDHPEVLAASRRTGCRLLVPSGAIAGLDGIKSASMGKLSRVAITTRKPPAGLEGAPYLVERGISLSGLTQELEVFSGSVREAYRGFPANVNVLAAVSLAGLGPDETQSRILAVPGLKRNCHDVDVEGDFGCLRVHVENIPSENPRTGRLTVLSIIRSIQDAADPVRLGT